MSFAMSDYLEGQMIAHCFRTATFSKPSGLWIGAFTVSPSDAGGGTEVTGGSYARVARAPLDANWAAPVSGNGQTSNVAAIAFPTPTANWGTLVALGIFDALTAGNLLFWGPLAVPKTVNNGDGPPTINAGALVLAFD